MCGGSSKLFLLPLSVFILMPTTFFTTYIIAVCLGHVEPDFPYISDTGTDSPESCIFGQLLNIAAVLVGLTVYVRCKQVAECNQNEARLLRLNKYSFVLGLAAALGISVVGNFQETNVMIVHLIGAMMAFGLGTIYCWIQTYMSYKMRPLMNTSCMCHTRLIICVTTTVSFIGTYVFDTLAKQQYNGKDPRKWYPSDGGFVPHVISTASEWLMAISMLFYFTTYIKEFQRISWVPPAITVTLEPPYTSVHDSLPDMSDDGQITFRT